jgi:nuclear transport factor 2 (NTF2) superfamily protein
VWAFHDNRIAVRFAYEWHDDSGNWFRGYGNENWEFDAHGLMRLRIALAAELVQLQVAAAIYAIALFVGRRWQRPHSD